MNLTVANLKSTVNSPSVTEEKRTAALAELRNLAPSSADAGDVLREIGTAPGLSVAIAIPSYNKTVACSLMKDLVRLTHLFRSRNVSFELLTGEGCPYVSLARNELASQFYFETKSSHLLFWDADLSINPGNILDMLKMNKDFIAGNYATKTISWERVRQAALMGFSAEQLAEIASAGEPTLTDLDGILDFSAPVEVDQVPGGCMLIKREVLARIIDHHPELRFAPFERSRRNHNFGFFSDGVDQQTQRYISEDFRFCSLVRSLGFKVYLSPCVRTQHFGTQSFKLNLPQLVQLQRSMRAASLAAEIVK